MSDAPYEHVTSHHVLTLNLGVAGNLFGGILLCWVDEAAALYAHKVAINTFVTYEMDKVRFLRPCKTGEIVNISARLLGTTRSGLEIEMKAERIHGMSGEPEQVLTTRVIMVAVDETGVKTALRLRG